MQLQDTSTTGGAAAGGLGSALDGLSSLASFAGPVGSALGAGFDLIKGLLPAGNPRVPFGASANAAAPHRATNQLDMSNFAQDNGNEFTNWANQFGVTVEAINDGVAHNMRVTGHSWEQVVVWYRTHPADIKADLIASGGYLSAGSATVPLQAVTQAAMHLPASAQPVVAQGTNYDLFTGQPLAPGNSLFGMGGGSAATPEPKTAADYIKILLGGAVDGTIKAGMNTPAGQTAKNEGVKSWLKENQLVAGLGGLAVTWAFAKAFKLIN